MLVVRCQTLLYVASCCRCKVRSTKHKAVRRIECPPLGLFQADRAPVFKFPANCPRRFRALIQVDRVSIIQRPHSRESGRHHRAPAFKRSCRVLIQAEFIAPRCAPSFNGSDPTSCAPSIKSSRSPHDGQRPQSSNQAAPVDAARLLSRPHSSHSGLRSPLRSALIPTEAAAQNPPGIISGSGLLFGIPALFRLMFLIPVWSVHGLFRVRSATNLVFYIQVVGRDGSCGESGLGFGRVGSECLGLFCFGFGDGLGYFELRLATGWVVFGWLS
jgi:hypothetical protein